MGYPQTDTRQSYKNGDFKTDTSNSVRIGDLQTDTPNSDRIGDLQTDTPNSGRIGDLQTDTPNSDRIEDLQTDTPNIDRIGDLQTDTRGSDRIGDLQADTPKSDRIGDLQTDTPNSGRIGDLQTDTPNSDRIEDLQTDTPNSDRIGDLQTDTQNSDRKMPDKRRKERGANKISACAEQTDDISPNYSSKIIRRALICIFAFCSQSLPCAGGSDLEDRQHKQQAVSDIYQHTLSTVSHCPSLSEYKQRSTDKCAEECTNMSHDGSCSYHCMRDSYKTSLVEFCAKPKLLFDYCPEYDPIGQTIQKDIHTPCNSFSTSQRVYSSSDLFFCDRGNCLQLREAGVSSGEISLMTDTTQVSGDLDESWLSQYWYIVLLLGVALMPCIVLGSIFLLLWRLKVIQQWTKKGNPDNVQNVSEQAVKMLSLSALPLHVP